MAPKIDLDAHLTHARRLKPSELKLRTAFQEWLPDSIIDCHAHALKPEHVCQVTEFAYHHLASTYPSFTLEQSRDLNELFHPGTRIRTLRFSGTFYGTDFESVNEYLLTESPGEDRVAVVGIPSDPDYTISTLGHARVSALKMYYASCNPPAKTIFDFFPPDVLKVAEEKDIPIILHPPCIVTGCLDQFRALIDMFPRLRIVIAHLGLTKMVVPGLSEAYEELARHENVFMDTSMVPSGEVVRLAISIFGCHRIMYGSDAPISMLRSTAYQHPTKGQRVVTDYPYHWVDPDDHAQYGRLADEAPHAHWQALQAIRIAVDSFPEAEQSFIKQQVFHDNACQIFGF